MSDDDDSVPATAGEFAAALKDGDIDALVELAKTLHEKTGDREFIDLFTRKPRGNRRPMRPVKGTAELRSPARRFVWTHPPQPFRRSGA
jgi:hypothetical protein